VREQEPRLTKEAKDELAGCGDPLTECGAERKLSAEASSKKKKNHQKWERIRIRARLLQCRSRKRCFGGNKGGRREANKHATANFCKRS